MFCNIFNFKDIYTCRGGLHVKKLIVAVFSIISGACIAFSAETANLMINGNCEDPENPLKYWTVEYPNNQNYINNLKYFKLLPEFGGKKNVIRLVTTNDPGYGGFPQYWAGTVVDSPLIPFEQGCRYRFSFNIMASSPYHIYTIGYGFKPGLKPYEHPVLDDMRMAYKGGICEQTAKKGSWTKVDYDWPDKQLSQNGMKATKNIAYMSLHMINITQIGEVFIKDVTCVKLPDGYTGGKITDDEKKPATGSSKTGTGKTKTGK